MAKKRRRKGRRRRKGGKRRARARKGKTLGAHRFGGRSFRCYGKRVRAGRSHKKIARVFCGRTA